METNCAKCSLEITGIEYVTCRGYCGSVFHMTCSGVSRALSGYFTSHRKNLFWMCDKCAELFENSHLRSITNLAVEKSPLLSLTEAITNLQTEIKQLSSKPVPSILPPAVNRWPTLEATRPSKRFRGSDSVVSKTSECQSGSKLLGKNVISVPTCEKPAAKFWLYLSRIQRDVSNEAISEMVKANLELENEPDVVKLVAKGTDTSNMTFISFKVGLDPALKKRALDPSSWPEGVLFREFEDHSAQKFRRPSGVNLTPTPVSPQTTFAANQPMDGPRDAQK